MKSANKSNAASTKCKSASLSNIWVLEQVNLSKSLLMLLDPFESYGKTVCKGLIITELDVPSNPSRATNVFRFLTGIREFFHKECQKHSFTTEIVERRKRRVKLTKGRVFIIFLWFISILIFSYFAWPGMDWPEVSLYILKVVIVFVLKNIP